MAFTSKTVRSESRVLGGGFDSNGAPVQGKTRIVGRLAGSYATGGLTLTPADLGLAAIDFIDFRVTTPAPTANGERNACYNGSTLFLQDPDGDTEEGNGTTFVIEYVAEGDASRNVELLA